MTPPRVSAPCICAKVKRALEVGDVNLFLNSARGSVPWIGFLVGFWKCGLSTADELVEDFLLDINGENHALAAVRLGGSIGLLAVEETGLVACEGVVKGVEVRDILGIEIIEVSVDVGTLKLCARLVEGGLSQGVVLAQEIKMNTAASGNMQDWWVISQRSTATDDDRLDRGIRTRDNFGRGRRSESSQGNKGDSSERMHVDRIEVI